MIATMMWGGLGRAHYPTSGGASGEPVPAANTSALLHFDGVDGSTTFTDETGKSWTAGGSVEIDTARSVFGTASGLFPDAPTQLPHITTANHADFDFGTGDFTIDFRMYWTDKASATFQTIYDRNYTSSGGLLIQSSSATGADVRKMVVYINGVTVLTESSAASTGTFIHYRLTRSGTTVTMARNGTSTGSGTSSASISNSANLRIGARSSVTQYAITGNMDELLILKGLALTASGFTPPTLPYVIV